MMRFKKYKLKKKKPSNHIEWWALKNISLKKNQAIIGELFKLELRSQTRKKKNKN